jgi:hypothetical protein
MRTNILYYITGFSVIIVFLFVVGVLAFHEVPEHNRELFIHLLGIIEGAFVSGLVATFFGSSKRDHDPGTITETETKTETQQP